VRDTPSGPVTLTKLQDKVSELRETLSGKDMGLVSESETGIVGKIQVYQLWESEWAIKSTFARSILYVVHRQYYLYLVCL